MNPLFIALGKQTFKKLFLTSLASAIGSGLGSFIVEEGSEQIKKWVKKPKPPSRSKQTTKRKVKK